MIKRIIYLTLISISMLIFSCETDTDIGYSILPENDILNINIIDTSSVSVFTISMDSVATNNVSTLLLGEYIDPIFGYSKASFVCEYGFVTSPKFTSSHVVDSAVLYLVPDTINLNHYGNFSNNQNITVYELENNLYDTTYYSNYSPSTFLSGAIIGQKSYNPKVTDTLVAIKLQNTFAQKFTLNNLATDISIDDFKSFFKGVYVASETTGDDGAILKYKINTDALIKVYSHNGSTEYIFNLTSNLATNIRFNLFEHNYSSTEFYTTIGNETSTQDSVAYIQSMGGLQIKIMFPNIKKLKNLGDISINRAELIINVAPAMLTFESEYSVIDRMVLTAYDPNDGSFFLSEYISGSTYRNVAINDGSYRFDIAGYIRDILDETIENNGLLLLPGFGSTDIKRSIITSGKHSDKMKLVISYTKL